MGRRTCPPSPLAEVLGAMAELAAFSATLPEAGDFFIKHAKPDSGTITAEDAAKTLLFRKQRESNVKPFDLRSSGLPKSRRARGSEAAFSGADTSPLLDTGAFVTLPSCRQRLKTHSGRFRL